MNYQVRNSGHQYDLIAVSLSGNILMFRAFKRYTGTLDGMTIINNDNFYSDINKYPTQTSLIVFNGITYCLDWYRQLSFEENYLVSGGTYAVVKDDNTCRVLRLDLDKYPDTETSDWKYVRSRSYKLMVKFHLINNNKSWDSINWVFYLNGEFESTAFMFNGNIDSTIRNDIETYIFPEFTYSISNDRKLTLSTDTSVSGKLKIEEEIGNLPKKKYELINGNAVIDLPNTPVKFDILFGYNKILEINELE